MADFTDTFILPSADDERSRSQIRFTLKVRDMTHRVAKARRDSNDPAWIADEESRLAQQIADMVAAGRVTKLPNNIFTHTKDWPNDL